MAESAVAVPRNATANHRALLLIFIDVIVPI
jgi:hypothetical protein